MAKKTPRPARTLLVFGLVIAVLYGLAALGGTWKPRLGLDLDRFQDDLRRRKHEARVAQDVESADLSGVSGTPTFFINGQRHYGAFDLASLTAAVTTARAQLRVTT